MGGVHCKDCVEDRKYIINAYRLSLLRKHEGTHYLTKTEFVECTEGKLHWYISHHYPTMTLDTSEEEITYHGKNTMLKVNNDVPNGVKVLVF